MLMGRGEDESALPSKPPFSLTAVVEQQPWRMDFQRILDAYPDLGGELK